MRNSQNKKFLFSIFSRVCFRSKLSFWLFLFILLFSYSSVLAWTPPQSPPPQDNVPQPLNTGPTAQGKLGNLGIGTTTPSYPLDVSGQARFTDILTGTAFYSGIYFFNPASNTLSLDVMGSIRAIGTTNDNYLAGNLGVGIAAPDGKLEVRQTGSDDIFNLYDNTTNVLTVLDGGNVGIGISAPTGLLDVNNKLVVSNQQITMNVPLNLAAAGDISIASDLQFTSPTASYIKSYAPLYLQAGDSNHSYDLTLRAFNSGEVVSDAPLNLSNNRITNLATPVDDTDAATKGYVDDIEYWGVTDSYLYPTSMDYTVGIGTNTPSVDLQIHDSGAASELLLSSDADKQSMIYFEDGQTGIYEPANSEDLRFWTGSGDSMTITSDGKVGIGTASPLELLEIEDLTNPAIRIEETTSGSSIQLTARSTTYRELVSDWAGIYTDSGSSGIFISQGSATGSIKFVVNSHQDEAMRIISSGNVGIGTTSPNEALEVVGNIQIGHQGYIKSNNSVGNVQNILGVDGTNFLILGAENNINGVKINDAMILLNSGNVGIGITNPAQKLHLNQSDSTYVYSKFSNSTTGITATDGFDIGINSEEVAVVLNRENTDMIFGTNNTERMRILANGNVGIGMTPTGLLDIQATDNLKLRFYNSTTFKAGIEVATTVGDMISTSNIGDLAIRSQSDLLFSAGGNTEAMRIDSDGNVGIGTTSPQTDLEVRGGIRVGYNDFLTAQGDRSIYVLDNTLNNVAFSYWDRGVATGGSFDIQSGREVTEAYTTLEQNNAGNITLRSNGYVGIGTTVPAAKLDVAGQIRVGAWSGDDNVVPKTYVDDLFVGTPGEPGAYWTKTTTGDHIYKNNSGGVGIGTIIPEEILDISGGNIVLDNNKGYLIERVDGVNIPVLKLNSDNLVTFGAASSTAGTRIFQFRTSGESPLMTILGSGNVGIGTTSPLSQTRLHIAKDLSYSQSQSGQLYVGGVTNTNKRLMLGYDTTNNFGFIESVFFGDSYRPTVINPVDGNVGIATTVPQYKLDVRGAIAAGTAASTNRIHFVATPVLNTDAATRGYIDDNFAPLSGGAGGTGAAFVQGGNSFGDLAVLGTNDNYDLTFETNNTRQVTIDTDGNVGIGTIGPHSSLEISSALTAELILNRQGSWATGPAGIKFATNNDVSDYWTLGMQPVSNNDFYLKKNANTYLTVLGSGNVGIGTTIPQSELDVDGLIKMRDSTITQDEDVINKGYLDATMVAGDYDWAGVGGDPSLAGEIYHTGNVGIGVTDPDNKLHVNGDIRIESSAGGNAWLYYEEDSALRFVTGYRDSTDSYAIYSYGTSNDVMSIERITGNVGIGTADPQQELHVQGDVIGSVYYDLVDSNYYLDPGANIFSYGLNTKGSIYSEGSANNYFAGNVGIGTTVPDTILTIANDEWISAKDSAGTGHVNMFKVNTSNEIEVGGTLNIGTIGLAEDSGVVTLVNMPVSSTPSVGTEESYSFAIDSESILKVYSEADGTGGIQNKRVGIGTTSPSATLDVWGDLYADQGNITTDNLGNITAKSFYDKDGVLYYLDPASTTWGLYTQGSISSLGTTNDNYFAGNVGIGVSDPDQKLDVDGDINIVTSGQGIRFRNSGTQRIWNDSSTGSWYSAYQHHFKAYDGASSYPEYMTINVGGNVGIGTTGPISKLDVRGSGSPSQGEDWTEISLGSNSYNERRVAISAYRSNIGADWDHMGLAFKVHESTSADVAPVTKMVIDYNGNVGIGTTGPLANLEVGADNAQVIFSDDGNTDRFIAFNVSSNTPSISVDNADSLIFGEKTNSYDASLSIEHMRINSIGNVGIGTNDPQYKLDVRGGNVNIPDASQTQDNFAATVGYVKSMTGGGTGGGVGTGTSGQTLRNDGDGWVANSIIYNNGTNVGIGTTNPGAKLDIYGGDARVTEDVNGAAVMYVSNPNLGESARSLFTLQNNTGSVEIGLGGSGRIDGWANDFWLWNGATGGNTRFGTNGTERMRITSAGYVAIGTTTPQGKLHVQTASDIEIFRTEDETGSAAMVIDKDGNVIISL